MLRQRHTDVIKKEQPKEVVNELPKSSTSLKNGSFRWFFILIICFFIVLYVVVPLAFYFSSDVRRHAVFLHYVSLSRNKNLSHPSEVGLNCTRHFYIESDNNINLGTWHVLPFEALARCDQDALKPDKEFTDSSFVFLYLHGNAGTRAGGHRVQLYKVLSEKVNSHVVAFDYRGYGDSTNIPPSDDGIVSDAVHVYEWLTKHVSPKRILIWGHSLGTGVATALMEILSTRSKTPLGLILEAPFTKLIDVVKHHPLSFFHRHMPFFEFFFADPIGRETSAFDSISRIGQIKAPVLILHAEDDGFVPFFQGKKLYEKAVAERPHDLYLTRFVGFEGKLDYGHKNIYRDPSLPDIIKQFIDNLSTLSET